MEAIPLRAILPNDPRSEVPTSDPVVPDALLAILCYVSPLISLHLNLPPYRHWQSKTTETPSILRCTYDFPYFSVPVHRGFRLVILRIIGPIGIRIIPISEVHPIKYCP
jgi:hypothetical protein